MSEENELVTQKVENGTYFTEALSWYNTRYTFINTQFSQLFLVATACVTAFILTFLSLIEFLPITDKKLFVAYHEITPEKSISVKGLMNTGQNPDYAVALHFVGEYVKSREEYIIERSERDFNYVYNLSANSVLQDYLNAVSPDNPKSPYVVYSNTGKRDIEVTSIEFYNKNGDKTKHIETSAKAIVHFTATENFGSSSQQNTNYEATIQFDYKKIIVDQKTEMLTHKPELLITSYTTKIYSGDSK